jgi:RNA polymerase sigma-70 factor (ECF subfamily)
MDQQSSPQDWKPELYQEYLLVLARVRLGPVQCRGLTASDFVQLTMEKALKHRDQFHGQTEEKWRAWLRAILANSIASACRSQRERVLQSLDQSSTQLEAFLVDGARSPSSQAQHNEQLRALAIGLSQLGPDERTAMELRRLHVPCWSLSQIAKHLNRRNEKSVANLLARAMRKLRIFLKAHISGTPAKSGESR